MSKLKKKKHRRGKKLGKLYILNFVAITLKSVIDTFSSETLRGMATCLKKWHSKGNVMDIVGIKENNHSDKGNVLK